MKKTTLLLSLFFSMSMIAFSVLITEAKAGNREGQFSLSPVIGGITFFGKQRLDTGPFLGIREGFNFTDNFGVEALFDYGRIHSAIGATNVDFFRYGADMLYHFRPGSSLVPYVAAGIAGINFNAPKGIALNGVKGSFDYGAGIKYFLTDKIAVRGDVRHLLYSHGNTLNTIEYSFGLLIPLGGEKQK